MRMASGLTWGKPALAPDVSTAPVGAPAERTVPPATTAVCSSSRRVTSVRRLIDLVLSSSTGVYLIHELTRPVRFKQLPRLFSQHRPTAPGIPAPATPPRSP